MNIKFLFLVTSLFGFLGVSLGAFGAHGLKAIISPELMVIFETGNKYHFYHTIVALVVILFYRTNQNKFFLYSIFCFLLGIIIFSGSLYLLAITGVRILGAITPIGGISFLIGWTFLFIGVWKEK